MNRFLFALVLLSGGFAAGAFSAEVNPDQRGGTAYDGGTGKGKSMSRAGYEMFVVTGTVIKKQAGEITVRTETSEKTLVIEPITQGVENAKEGAKVRIGYIEEDGKFRARQISPAK